MDEPFSAVDPVVRAELQQELLRLRETLSQTIVFVTHDIDEALLLGDRIVVFGPGGTIHQHPDPQTLLHRRAAPSVARMGGRDRGSRSPGSRPAAPEVAPREPAADAGTAPVPGAVDGWRLTCTDDGRPTAWVRGDERIPAGE